MQATRETIIFLIIVTTIILIILTFSVGLILYHYQNKRIYYTKYIDGLRSEFEKSLLRTQLEIQEQTIQHISREIHDNIGLSLTLAKLQLNTLDHESAASPKEKIHDSVELISTAIRDLSSISHSLNADIIGKQGLIKALEEEIERVRKTGAIHTHLEIRGNSIFLDPQKELILFRVAQEALNNTIKHAEARCARIELDYEENGLQMIITDDGKGFDSTAINSHVGSGLFNIEGRIKMINGFYDLETKNGETKIITRIPY